MWYELNEVVRWASALAAGANLLWSWRGPVSQMWPNRVEGAEVSTYRSAIFWYALGTLGLNVIHLSGQGQGMHQPLASLFFVSILAGHLYALIGRLLHLDKRAEEYPRMLKSIDMVRPLVDLAERDPAKAKELSEAIHAWIVDGVWNEVLNGPPMHYTAKNHDKLVAELKDQLEKDTGRN